MQWLLLAYILIYGSWMLLIRREQGIGVGVRYMFIINLTAQLLFAPLVIDILGIFTDRPVYPFEQIYRNQAIAFSLTGLAFFVIGAYLIAPWLMNRQHQGNLAQKAEITSSSNNLLSWQSGRTVYIIGVIAYMLLFIAMSIPTLRAIGVQARMLMYTGAVMMTISALVSSNKRYFVFALLAVALPGIYEIFDRGHIGTLFMPLFCVLSLWFLSQKMSLRSWIALAMLSLVFLSAMNVWLSTRHVIRSGILSGATFSQRIEMFVRELSVVNFSDTIDPEQGPGVQSRLDQSQLLTAAIVYTPQFVPFAGGSTITQALPALVPRFLWPDKPITAGGTSFVHRYTGIIFSTNVSIGLHPLFEFYVNFGLIGIIIGLCAFGVLCGWLDLWYINRSSSIFVQVFVIQMIWVLLWSNVMTEFVMSTVATLVVALIATILFKMFGNRQNVHSGKHFTARFGATKYQRTR